MKSHVYLSTWGSWFGLDISKAWGVFRHPGRSEGGERDWEMLDGSSLRQPSLSTNIHERSSMEHPRNDGGLEKGWILFLNFCRVFCISMLLQLYLIYGVYWFPEAPNTWTIWQLWICLTFLIRGLWGNIFDWMNCLYYLTETLPDDLIIAGLWRLVKNTKSAHTDQFFTIFELGLGC